ncbi:DNA topoisomerase 2-like protein isoform X2 [Tanacetum coccineum]
MSTEMQTDNIPQNNDLVERVKQTLWIRPVESNEETLWIWEDDQMIEKPITFVPLLYQIFDGILISAADRKGVKDILVNIDVADNNISVWNHGEGVHDLNFSIIGMAAKFSIDVSIRMGYGNLVSKEVFKSMGKKLKEFSISENWCMVSFKPNLAKFGMKNLEDDIVALMKRRVVDLAGCSSGVKVELDGTCVLPRTFQDYVQLYLETSVTHTTRIYEKLNDRWEICVAIADGHFEHFDQVSFVNNIAGGSHVDYITSQITHFLARILNLEPNDIKSYLWVFVNAHIGNPVFDSQTKEKLTLQTHLKICFKKSNARKLNIPKLQDAKLADTPYSQQCTLILTKGDFATDFVDKDKYGVFPLECMLLNVREASPQELEKNTDIQNIKKILGSRWAIDQLPSLFLAIFTKSQKVYAVLETIESKEGGEYNFDENIKDFVWDNDKDGDAIELAFSNMKIDGRTELASSMLRSKDIIDLDLKEKGIPYRDFMNKEFTQYAMADLQRSIPSMVDVTLVDTIIGMAQNYVGSNNINLLQPNGEFGTRWMGGKDHADGTLLFTRLSPITRYLFHKDDELLLNDLNEEDGQSIEPAWFIPIIPMVLVNGSEARGTLSSFIPNYNPRDIIANLIRLLEGEAMLAMLPWYRGFKGKIQPSASNEYTTYGIITNDKDKDALIITELPVRSWTVDYHEFLEAASRGGKDIKACNDDDTSVHFEITMTEKQDEGGLPNKLKLITTLSTANMYVLDAEGKLKKYDTPEELLEDFFRLRLNFYEKRKTSLLHKLKILENKEKFAHEVWDGEFVFLKKPKSEKCAELKKKGFKSLQSIKREAREETPPKEEDEDVEYIEELEKERKATATKLEHLNAATPESLWRKDLVALDEQLALEGYPEAKYTEAEKKARAKRAGDAAGQSANKKRQGEKKAPAKRVEEDMLVTDSDEEESSAWNM